jgi:hypothetical protein|tara:strand:- start:752 stop:1534 length:783 start_codon:yes stop_codon:yes gene_type:complete
MAKPLAKKILVAPLAVLTDDRLRYQERAVLLALYSYLGAERKVYPSREQLAKRSGIGTVERISNLTTSLKKHGWLQKQKKGWTGRNQYYLSIPIYMLWTSFGEALVSLSNTITESATVIPNVTSIVTKDITPIVVPDITINKQTILTNHINKPHMGESDLFNIFYDEYPKQVGRKKAHETWLAMNPSQQDLDAMLINISDRLIRGVWSKDNTQYIPHPANYLSGEQWSDELISRNNHEQCNKLTPAEQFRANAASNRNMG